MLAHSLNRLGVGHGHESLSRAEISSIQIARHQVDDRLMVSLAHAVFNLILPTEDSGTRPLLAAQKGEVNMPKLFEKAIGRIFAAELPREDGWRVTMSKQHEWPRDSSSSGIDSYLPKMETDIIVENINAKRRIIIDTKFTDILSNSRFNSRRFRFKRNHLFQLYAYLRSQEKVEDPISFHADGILLYPSIGQNIDETAVIQGHRIRFVTVDLNRPSSEVTDQLREIPILCTL